VICTFNSEEYIEDNLRSIREQNYDNQEIIIVDNCSSDATRDIIEKEFPETRLIVMPNTSYGACETFNIGFETAKGEYIAIMDDDVELEPNWTKELVSVFKSSGDDIAVLHPQIKEPQNTYANEEGYLDTFQGCGVLVRSEILEEFDYYDERFFIYGNDVELSYKFRSNNYKIKSVPSVTTFHKTSWSKDTEYDSFKTFYTTRNHLWFTWKYFRTGDAVSHSLYWIIKKTIRAKRDRELKSHIKGILSAFKSVHSYGMKERNPLEELKKRKPLIEHVIDYVKPKARGNKTTN